MTDISVIIPAYNEQDRIVPTIRSFYEFLNSKGISFEIIVADDGSTDRTVDVVSAMQLHIRELSIIISPVNRGKGSVVRQGMLAARGRYRIFSDADGSTPATELDKLLYPLQAGLSDIAIGSRYLASSEVLKAQPKIRVIWSRMTHSLVQRILLPGIVDPHCGFKAFTSEAAHKVFSRCTIDGWSFDLEALAIALRLKLSIEEVPVKWANDERSKVRLSHLPAELSNIFRIRKKLAAFRCTR